VPPPRLTFAMALLMMTAPLSSNSFSLRFSFTKLPALEAIATATALAPVSSMYRMTPAQHHPPQPEPLVKLGTIVVTAQQLADHRTVSLP
jgi:hypothetical protein